MIFRKWVRFSSLHSVSALFLVLIILIPSLEAEEDGHFEVCSRPFDCGRFKNLTFPFWGENRPQYCGHEGYKLDCGLNGDYPVMLIHGKEFLVHEIYQFGKPQNMTISRRKVYSGTGNEPCPSTLNPPLLQPLSGTVNMPLLIGCSNIDPSRRISCSIRGQPFSYFFLKSDEMDLQRCSDSVQVAVQKEAFDELNMGITNLSSALSREFDVQFSAWDEYCIKCNKSGGICGMDQNLSTKFACYCKDRPSDIECGGKEFNWKKLVIGLSSGIIGGIAIAAIVFIYFQRRRRARKYADSYTVSQYSSFAPSSLTDAEKGGNFPGVHHFSYKELEEATYKFDSAKELGDGGFGTVYYGKLKDGRAVAVKRLYEHNYKRVEQFWNEVGLLAHLRHPNLVSLYGYTSRHSRELLLVYEYVSNGTVADHLHGNRAKPGALPWSTRLEIAIETANALTYLHASDVIHRDVKTNNILIDENFSVKVADFGLSRLFPTDVTHVSTAPQGTPGYVDPEYHECYQLTDKSDVFSFGVVLIELISSKPAVDITRHRHEINLSNMAINKIQNRALHELVDPTLGYESDNKVKSSITAVAEVAFQCLQGGKDMRPTMGEVYEALKGVKSGDFSKGKAEEMDVHADEVVLLKSGPLTASPDSVAVKWFSSSSVSNASN